MHWAAGPHGDVTSRIAELAAVEGVGLTSLHVTAAQGFASQGSFARGEAVGLVFDLAWEIRITTDAAEAQVGSIVERALQSSPADAAMTTGKEGAFALHRNGRGVALSGLQQSGATAEIDPFTRRGRSRRTGRTPRTGCSPQCREPID